MDFDPEILRQAAATNRLRCYRDRCGDWNIPGRRGEIYLYDAGHISVQIGGPRADGTATAITEKGANVLIRRLEREGRWHCQIDGDGEGVFVAPLADLALAAKLIQARRSRKGGQGPPAEARIRGLEAIRSARRKRDGSSTEHRNGPGIDDPRKDRA